jgi:hypothetical protein
MPEATVFRPFAEDALREPSKAVREDDKQALEELAKIWAKAALASSRLFGRGLISWPRCGDEAMALTRPRTHKSGSMSGSLRSDRNFPPKAGRRSCPDATQRRPV